jgi:hypothetical protein
MGMRYRGPLLLVLTLAACSRHVKMEVPQTSAGARYTCAPGKACVPATTDVPSELNASGTAFVVLPAECKGRINRIVVLDADSSNPKLDVTCAPLEEPVQEMQ